MRPGKHYWWGLSATIFACTGLAWLSTMLPAEAQSAAAAGAPSVVSMASVKPPSLDKFSSAPAAAQHCPGGTVVWASLSKSRVFHLSESKYFGKTRHGAFVCEKDAVAAGYHASKR